MMGKYLDVQWVRYEMHFKTPARTSRNTLTTKPSWLIRVRDDEGALGWGECSIIPGLSPDEPALIESTLNRLKIRRQIDLTSIPHQLPALRFALEMAVLDLKTPGVFTAYSGDFSNGNRSLEINGLIWMDGPDGLIAQANRLVETGFKTLKAKVGTMPFEQELNWIRSVRSAAPNVTLRVDANGAFSKSELGWSPLDKLKALAELGLHSIEQPLVADDHVGLAELCRISPLPIALDESLIGVMKDQQGELLDAVCPDYLVLKPSLLGGFSASQYWISEAERRGIGWWVTSALETNVGLNAIAQWTANGIQSESKLMPQGLGTGALFTNHISGPLDVKNGFLSASGNEEWEAPELGGASECLEANLSP